MSLVYLLVARGAIVLADAPHLSESVAPEITAILQNIDSNVDSKVTYKSERFNYHVACHRSLTFICSSSFDYNSALAFGLLQELVDEFSRNAALRNEASFSAGFGLQAGIGSQLLQIFEKYRSPDIPTASSEGSPDDATIPEADRNLNSLKVQIAEVKGIMTENVERLLERGDRLDELIDRSENLENNASSFRTTSRQLRRHFCVQNARCTIIIALSVTAALIVVILIVLYETGVLGKASKPK